MTDHLAAPSEDRESDPRKHRPHSLTPSVRRGERPLRSSPLAGPSYYADKSGNVLQHSSALEEEIARRRRSGLLNEDDLAGLDALSTPALSRKGSADMNEPSGSPRRARPSFISLTPRPGSRGSLSPSPAPPQTPQSPSPSPASSPMLRTRHSSPHIAADAAKGAHKPVPPRPSTSSSTADWMTAAPAPSFSRLGARNAGVVLPVKASSRAGERIRRKSAPGTKPESHLAKHDSHSGSKQAARSLKSFRSMSRLFKGGEHEDVPPVPAVVTPSGHSTPRSRSSSTSSGEVKLHIPATDDSDPKMHNLSGPPESKFSIDVSEPHAEVAKEPEREREGRVKRLWARVVGGVRKNKAHA